ncbi:hypothetical protein GQ53DRAFT_46468 [Thozetella sp. PMI_491]|nr:hypothetical protein GQ53DRAFT_46468 [Thozetella sp. PMI_491]
MLCAKTKKSGRFLDARMCSECMRMRSVGPWRQIASFTVRKSLPGRIPPACRLFPSCFVVCLFGSYRRRGQAGPGKPKNPCTLSALLPSSPPLSHREGITLPAMNPVSSRSSVFFCGCGSRKIAASQRLTPTNDSKMPEICSRREVAVRV